jgi:hypothetical protein
MLDHGLSDPALLALARPFQPGLMVGEGRLQEGDLFLRERPRLRCARTILLLSFGQGFSQPLQETGQV